LFNIYELNNPISVSDATSELPSRNKRNINKKFYEGGLLGEKSFNDLIEALMAYSEEIKPKIEKFSVARKDRIAKLSSISRQSLGNQKEAVTTALLIAGIDKENISGWDYNEDKGVKSFLDGLEQVRLREDPMITHDMFEFPGHEIVRKVAFSAVVFESDMSKLTIVLAHRQPLEEQTGADLIYMNETFSCFTMVQYKAMEKEGDESIFRFPTNDLTKEIARMDAVLSELKKCRTNDHADGFRLSENPFFLKICPRINFEPDNAGLVKGMYLPLDYWRFISLHPGVKGPKGGNALSYRNVRRYFDNTEFITLVSGGWIGTNTYQTSVLEEAIKSTLESGKAAIIAVNKELDIRHRVGDGKIEGR
jgi:hypothetical protein